ncbi:cupin domain-containing protein [Lentzea sp. NPDC051213]|uniref:cupin domain-containing protein n=1 Tax=Lentzea sp. NPDC051213 TaxID=3364126 RepID=UPI0037B12BB0
MRVISETEERTTRTPAGLMAGLAAPSQGSNQISTWRVEMAADVDSPLHLIDHDQIWTFIAGTWQFTVGDETVKATVGQTVVLEANEARQFRVIEGPGQAIVAMLPNGKAGAPGSDVRQALPWAQ